MPLNVATTTFNLVSMMLGSAQGGVIDAASANDWQTLEEELQKGGSASEVDTSGCAQRAKELTEVNDASCCRCTALHFAAKGDAPLSTVEALLKAHPDAAKMKKDRDDRLPLHLAAKHNLNMPSIRLLLDAYPEAADAFDQRDKTPLTYAQMRGEVNGEMAQLLTTPAILKKVEGRKRRRAEAMAGENPVMKEMLLHDEL